MKKRVADIIMDCLVERGVTDCFAVTGGGAMFIDNALYHCKGITKYFNHHEQACAIAAEAYARSTGKIALVSVTSGPGGTNTLTGVMGAYVDSIPMIIISGQVRYAVSVPKTGLKLRTRAIQEFDIVNTVKTMTKYSKLIINPLDIKMEINKAIDIALTGRRGPVWLDVPQDVQSSIVDLEELTPCEVVSKPINNLDITFVFNEIKKAKRPVLLAGAGITSTNTVDLFRSVAEKLKIPVVSSCNGSNSIYRNNDIFFGPIGINGQRSSNLIVQNSDLIVSFGCSLGFSVTGFGQSEFAKDAKIIAIDIDGDELKKPGIKLYKAFVCDVAYALNSILESNIHINISRKWISYCRMVKTKFSPFEAILGKKGNERVCSYLFWNHFFQQIGDKANIVLGNNTAIASLIQIGNERANQQIYANYNCGSMGYDVPAAIGVAIGKKSSVILATGDGSIMMNLQELQTIIHHKLPIKIVLFENNGYNAVRQTSKNFFNGELIGCTPETGISFPSFKEIFTSFGFRHMVCQNNESIPTAINEFLKCEAPCVLEVKELLDDPITPKLMSRKTEDNKMLTPALHDMYPFLPEEELDELMGPSRGKI